MIELGVNILLSYIVLAVVTYVLRNRLKNTLVYTLFWHILYSIPCVYYAIDLNNPAFIAPPLFSTIALVFACLHRLYKSSSIAMVLIPLPQVVALVYLVLVYLP